MPKLALVRQGDRYGNSIINKEIDRGYRNGRRVECKCDCGKYFYAQLSDLRNGDTKSCGCLKVKKASERLKTHGESGSVKNGAMLGRTKLYDAWADMKKRCYNKRNKEYHNYGERGVFVCDNWRTSYVAFKEWALLNGYREGLTIERKNVNGNYHPENCCWATRKQQALNTRRNRFITFGDKTQTLKEWADETKIRRETISKRLNKGVPVERALQNKPMEKHQIKKGGHHQCQDNKKSQWQAKKLS